MSADQIQLVADNLSEELESMMAVDGLLDRNAATISSVTMLVEAHTELKAKLAKIPTEAIRRQSLKTTFKGTKVLGRNEIAHAAFIVEKALKVTGRRKGIDELKNLPVHTEKNLAKMRFIQLGQYCKGLYDLMNTHKLSLVDLAIDETQIETFNTAVQQYNDTVENADIARGQGEASTEQIEKLFDDAELTMDDIFDIMDTLQDKYPVLYSEFKQVAEIREYGNRHRDEEEEPVTPPTAPAGTTPPQ